MKITLAKYCCVDSSHTFEAPLLDEGRYGEFLLWSSTGSVAYLNAFEDLVYSEVRELVENIMSDADLFQVAELLQKIFGYVACDPDAHGALYSINEHPSCPICGGHRITSWEMIEPKKLVELEILEVTHHGWNQLSSEQKHAAVAKAIHAIEGIAFPRPAG
jgi:hypothetical protein